ncbi:hypothetical protein Vadar_026772 [Vaccinium darrowii]|uniref:Uncharacterized protein n=1 Tax=Vaccinium darrowii TaxID=229202 RepID=A0ACB7ZF38_9ERIC|nr:hypothetical protein Vadar_026772 [Vaccinium darrowii]
MFDYAMTINKSQGQFWKYVGLDLPVPVFSHGQVWHTYKFQNCIAQFTLKWNQVDSQGISRSFRRLYGAKK